MTGRASASWVTARRPRIRRWCTSSLPRNSTIRNRKAGAAVLVRNRVTDVLVSGNEISDHRRFEWWHNYRKTGAQLLRVDYTDDATIATESGDDRYGRADAH